MTSSPVDGAGITVNVYSPLTGFPPENALTRNTVSPSTEPEIRSASKPSALGETIAGSVGPVSADQTGIGLASRVAPVDVVFSRTT
jgi:hypothetical protein